MGKPEQQWSIRNRKATPSAQADRNLKLYEQAAKEEVGQFEFFMKGIAFHFGLVSALLALAIVGASQAQPGIHSVIFMLVCMVCFVAAQLGITSTTRLYRGWLEKVTVRAKFEQKLGLTEVPHAASGYWAQESIIAVRNLRDRGSDESSE